MKTRKNRLNNFLKTGILLLGISLLLWNCEQKGAEYVIPKNKIQVSHISFKELDKKENLKEILKRVEKRYNKKKEQASRDVYSADSTFYISTDYIYQTVKDSITNYSFKIVRPNIVSIKLENLIVSKNTNTNKLSLYIYEISGTIDNLTSRYYKITDQVLTDNLFGKVAFFYGQAVEVADCVIIDYIPCDGIGNADGHAATTNCDGSATVLDFSYCFMGGGGGSAGTLGGGGNPSSGGGSSTGGPQNHNPNGGGIGGAFTVNTGGVSLCPTCPAVIDGLFKNFIATLSLNQQNCISNPNSLIVKQTVKDFLTSNDFSGESQVFAKLALDNCGADVDWANRIILDPTFVNNPRLKCVYNKFKVGTNTISHYLENFLGEKAVAHLNFIADDNFKANHTSDYWGAGAITEEPVNYIIKITFNTDLRLSSSEQNMPTIILATEIIHEMIHAEMFRKLLSYAQQPNIPWTEEFILGLKNNFGGLADYYTRWWLKLPPNLPPTSAQHQLMAQHYREIIVSALKDFDNNQHSDEFYEALAWIGLQGTGLIDPNTNLQLNATAAWKNLLPNERKNINSIISNAINNESHNCTN